MIIANPLYDVVFKNMMENERVAKFFIGTILRIQIESIKVQPQEFTYQEEGKPLSVFRLDFIATIKTETGELSRILIEVQSTFHLADVMRFRNYLAEQYKKTDIVEDKKTSLPITTIYVLGFDLPEFKSACVKVGRLYTDLVTDEIIDEKSDFAEKLTHESYIIQVNKITERYQTPLDKLLSVFEQRNFIEDNRTIKMFTYPADTEELKVLTDILHQSGTDPEKRKELEKEEEAWRTMNFMIDASKDELNKAIQEKDKTLEENLKTIEEKDKALEEKDKALEDKDKAIEEYKKKLEEQDIFVREVKKYMGDKDKQIEDIARELSNIKKSSEEEDRN